ncbi:MAG: MXAN_5808 family serine peptidase [Deferrisomatales bacterium]
MHRKITLALVGAVALVGLVRAFPGSEPSGSVSSFGDPYPRIVNQVFYHVEKKYVEPERASPRKLVEGALRALETQYPQVLVDIPEGGRTARVRVDEAERTFDLGPADRFGTAGDVLNTVLQFTANHLAPDVERKDLYYFALNGALGGLDPHSNAFSPRHFKEFMIGTRGSFGGIGFVFGIRDGDMMIITPIDGTPADRGGLRSGDKILYIDGEPTINMPVDMAANKMRGEPGTQVTLTLSREGWPEPRPITFTREIIHVDSVESYVLKGDGDAPVVYAKVKNFQKDTTDELRKAIQAAEAAHKDLKGIVLDLRNNPGGLLEQAIELSDGFLDEGTIVSTRGPEEDANSRALARKDAPISRRPVVVLINQGSASASEIVAGALKHSRALVVGQKTFGKGSVQKLYPLTDGGALKLTVAQYLTTGDVSIQSIGIQPDVAVHPARVGEGKVRLGPPPSHMEEADLKNAFNQWGTAAEKPSAEIQYLEPAKDDEEKSFAELPREQKLERLRSDFEVRLARRVIGKVEKHDPARGRESLLKASGPVLAELRREEEAKVTQALGRLGVDWAGGAAAGPAPRLVVAPLAPLRLEAGTTARVTLTVRNEGTGPAERVWARTDTDNPALKNLDFAFGRIGPGEERSWTAVFEVAKSAVDRWDRMTVALKRAGSEEAGAGAVEIQSAARLRPEFSYRYELADENSADPRRSGDGVLEEGERMRLTLTVRNRGQAPAAAVDVNIRGDEKEELYLEAARHKLTDLLPGQEQPAPMAFRLVKASEEGKVLVGVSLADRDSGSFFSDNLSFPVGKAYSPREARVAPTFEFESPPPLRTSAARITLRLKVVDDEAVKDFYTYLGDKKIRYERNRGGAEPMAVELEVPLEPGSNRLILAARDRKEIVGSRTFHIFRATDGGPSLGLGAK